MRPHPADASTLNSTVNDNLRSYRLEQLLSLLWIREVSLCTTDANRICTNLM